MINFAAYLTESDQAVAAFHKAKAIDTGDGRFAAAMDTYAAGAQAKEIYNGPFKELYSFRVSRGVENGWQKLRTKYREQLKAIPGDDDFWGVNLQNLKKAHAFYSKHDAPAEVKTWLDAVVDLPDAIKVLKTYVKSGRPPKVSTNPIDQAKAAVAVNHANVDPTALLNDAVATFKAELYADTQRSFAKWYDQLKSISNAADIPDSPAVKSLATHLFITRPAFVDGKRVVRLELKPNAETIVQKISNEMVENIITEFVSKNTKKLGMIFKKKGAPIEHRIVRTNIRSNTLENTMFFKFADGSSFDIESQVVVKFTQTGKPFAQMPTRFRNVVMADGSKMSQPSEEKMLRTF